MCVLQPESPGVERTNDRQRFARITPNGILHGPGNSFDETAYTEKPIRHIQSIVTVCVANTSYLEKMTNKNILLNDFATRSFRDVADHDYISARLSYRHGLISQFHWQALQALEKYIKAILLYNRVKAKDINHNLARALKHTDKLPFTLNLSPSSLELIKHIDNFGRFRYLEISYFTNGPKLVQLDKAIWEIRRYCQVINYEVTLPDGSIKNMLDLQIEMIEQSAQQSPHKFRIMGGALESILDKKENPARAALVWQNGFFSGKARRFVKSPARFHAVNAPLSLHPEILEEVLEYTFIPNDVVNAYKDANK